MGLGVAMLPYLDAVYACDKTSFCLPYVKLGQSYEGGLSLTLSSLSRNLVNFTISGIVWQLLVIVYFSNCRLSCCSVKAYVSRPRRLKIMAWYKTSSCRIISKKKSCSTPVKSQPNLPRYGLCFTHMSRVLWLADVVWDCNNPVRIYRNDFAL
jgi:hypothetical protein